MINSVQRMKNLGYALLVCMTLSLIVYPLIHETGHLLAALVFGGEAHGIELGLFNARAFLSGSFNDCQNSVVSIAGLGFPYLFWLIYIILIPKRIRPAAEVIKYLTSVFITCTVIPWIIIPVLEIFGKASAGNDVIGFLSSSGIGSIPAALIFLIVFFGTIIMSWRKIQNIRELFDNKII